MVDVCWPLLFPQFEFNVVCKTCPVSSVEVEEKSLWRCLSTVITGNG